MRVASMVVLGICAYLVFLAATVPARFVAARLLAETQGRIQLLEPIGTLWSGTARAVVTSPAGAVAVDRLEWRLLPSRLASMRLAFDVKAALAGIDASLEIGRSPLAWEARGVRAGGEVTALSALLPLLAPWRPEGTFTASSPSFSWDERGARGDASIEWRAARVALSDVRPLGSYRAEVRAASGPAQITVTTLEGPLRVAGQGSLAPSGRLDFTGEARGEGAQAGALEPLLDLVGPRRADGSRALALRLN